jgi:hypothetical protein
MGTTALTPVGHPAGVPEGWWHASCCTVQAPSPHVLRRIMIPLEGGVSMWQGHLIHPVPSPVSPHDQPPLHRVYTPTPDGFERFLWDCLGLARGAGTPPWPRRPQPQPGATRAAKNTRALSL